MKARNAPADGPWSRFTKESVVNQQLEKIPETSSQMRNERPEAPFAAKSETSMTCRREDRR